MNLTTEGRKLNRRTFLTATAATPLAGAALAEPYDPLHDWIAERSRLWSDWLQHPDNTPEGEALWDELKVYEDRILDTPAVTVEGFKAQLHFAVEKIAKDYCEDDMTRRVLGSLLAGSEVLAV